MSILSIWTLGRNDHFQDMLKKKKTNSYIKWDLSPSTVKKKKKKKAIQHSIKKLSAFLKLIMFTSFPWGKYDWSSSSRDKETGVFWRLRNLTHDIRCLVIGFLRIWNHIYYSLKPLSYFYYGILFQPVNLLSL